MSSKDIMPKAVLKEIEERILFNIKYCIDDSVV